MIANTSSSNYLSNFQNKKDYIIADVAFSNPFVQSKSIDFQKVVKIPYNITSDTIKWTKAYLRKDEEAQIEAVSDVATALDISISSTNTLFHVIAYATVFFRSHMSKLPKFHHPFIIKALTLPIATIGLILCFFEAIYEVYSIYKITKLMIELNREENKNSRQTLLKRLRKLNDKYFSLNSDEVLKITLVLKKQFPNLSTEKLQKKFDKKAIKYLQIKFAQLARRISPWCATKVLLELKCIIKQLEDSDEQVQNEGIDQATRLIQAINQQSLKKLLIHLLGLIVILITIIGLSFMIAGLSATGILIPLLGVVGAGLALLRYLLEKGLLTQRGWTFSIDSCIPDPIKNLKQKIFNKIKV